MSEWVYINQFWPNVPVYHAYSRIRDEADVTICGRVIYEVGHPIHMTGLPERHAAKFARPCRRCFEVES